MGLVVGKFNVAGRSSDRETVKSSIQSYLHGRLFSSMSTDKNEAHYCQDEKAFEGIISPLRKERRLSGS